jgi:hypothetical protein
VTQGRAPGAGHRVWPVGALRTSAAVFIVLLSAISSRDTRPCAFGIAAPSWISCCTGEAGAAFWSRRASTVYHQCPPRTLRPRFLQWAHR